MVVVRSFTVLMELCIIRFKFRQWKMGIDGLKMNCVLKLKMYFSAHPSIIYDGNRRVHPSIFLHIGRSSVLVNYGIEVSGGDAHSQDLPVHADIPKKMVQNGPEFERVDEYGLGARESLADAVNVVIDLLGMQPCEGTEVVPSNSRSHTCLLSGVFLGNVKVLVRLSFGIDGPKQVAMKLAVRSEDEAVSDAV